MHNGTSSSWIMFLVATSMCGVICLMNVYGQEKTIGRIAYTHNYDNDELRDGIDSYDTVDRDTNELQEAGENWM